MTEIRGKLHSPSCGPVIGYDRRTWRPRTSLCEPLLCGLVAALSAPGVLSPSPLKPSAALADALAVVPGISRLRCMPLMLTERALLPLQPLPTNTRHDCAIAMEKAAAEEPWFGIEQEYTLLNSNTKRPLGALPYAV